MDLKYDKEMYLGNEIYGCDESYELLEEKVVKCNKEHICDCCDSKINKTDFAVYEKGIYDGEIRSTYTCIKCMEEWMRYIGEFDEDDEEDEED